jgi:hypothetical protein
MCRWRGDRGFQRYNIVIRQVMWRAAATVLQQSRACGPMSFHRTTEPSAMSYVLRAFPWPSALPDFSPAFGGSVSLCRAGLNLLCRSVSS